MTTTTTTTEKGSKATKKQVSPATAFIRRFATALTTVSFLGVGLTGLLMTFELAGHSLNGVHTVLGVAFVVAAVLHVVKNGKALMKLVAKRPVQVFAGLTAAAVVIAMLVASPGERRGPRGPQGAGGANVAQVEAPAATPAK
ncbi:MAG: DUF4405 domain-containing protein [Deltaproteobacteria bacterium]|nr:DUF4405 domain-containing protein [Deltaproteobacteria bacterium]